ncbi:hypothetical protein AB0G67_36400 [Streptomyces sp. NPDC021056]|uniref:hypothetical protein n=1 Tax=Streptomyces sp. NPDC021056 TaxID=3155012 RepID=UPI0033C4B5F3
MKIEKGCRTLSVNGSWDITMKTPMGTQVLQLELRSDGQALTGTQSSMGETTEIQDGTVNGDEATWKVDATKPVAVKVTFTAKFDGDEISGHAKAGFFPKTPFSGRRAAA